jgi:hypothetical protein
MDKCRKCKYHFLSIRNIDKCSKTKTDLGHAVVYNSCSNERSKDTGCGIDAVWFKAAGSNGNL